MDRDDLLLRFKEHLGALNRSQATIKSYLEHLQGFLMTVTESDMRKINRSMLEAYVAGLGDYRTKDKKPYASGSICMKVRAVKRFFEFLADTNIIFIDPSETLKEPKNKPRFAKNVLLPAEITKILDQPNLGTLAGIRDRAIIETLYATGMRKDELCGLSIYDLDLSGKILRINNGKGQKDRVVPLGKHAVRFLREYIANVRPQHTKKHRGQRRLFVDIHGKPLDKQACAVMIKKYGKQANIKKPVNPHAFRHAFATAMIRNGADITAVQRMLGHACLSTTQVYVDSLGLAVKQVHAKTHPREKDCRESRF